MSSIILQIMYVILAPIIA